MQNDFFFNVKSLYFNTSKITDKLKFKKQSLFDYIFKLAVM